MWKYAIALLGVLLVVAGGVLIYTMSQSQKGDAQKRVAKSNSPPASKVVKSSPRLILDGAKPVSIALSSGDKKFHGRRLRFSLKPIGADKPAPFRVRVFANASSLTAKTPTSNPHFVGTVSPFPLGNDKAQTFILRFPSRIPGCVPSKQGAPKIDCGQGGLASVSIVAVPVRGDPASLKGKLRIENVKLLD